MSSFPSFFQDIQLYPRFKVALNHLWRPINPKPCISFRPGKSGFSFLYRLLEFCWDSQASGLLWQFFNSFDLSTWSHQRLKSLFMMPFQELMVCFPIRFRQVIFWVLIFPYIKRMDVQSLIATLGSKWLSSFPLIHSKIRPNDSNVATRSSTSCSSVNNSFDVVSYI